jgi:hypothetical protein
MIDSHVVGQLVPSPKGLGLFLRLPRASAPGLINFAPAELEL